MAHIFCYALIAGVGVTPLCPSYQHLRSCFSTTRTANIFQAVLLVLYMEAFTWRMPARSDMTDNSKLQKVRPRSLNHCKREVRPSTMCRPKRRNVIGHALDVRSRELRNRNLED